MSTPYPNPKSAINVSFLNTVKELHKAETEEHNALSEQLKKEEDASQLNTLLLKEEHTATKVDFLSRVLNSLQAHEMDFEISDPEKFEKLYRTHGILVLREPKPEEYRKVMLGCGSSPIRHSDILANTYPWVKDSAAAYYKINHTHPDFCTIDLDPTKNPHIVADAGNKELWEYLKLTMGSATEIVCEALDDPALQPRLGYGSDYLQLMINIMEFLSDNGKLVHADNIGILTLYVSSITKKQLQSILEGAKVKERLQRSAPASLISLMVNSVSKSIESCLSMDILENSCVALRTLEKPETIQKRYAELLQQKEHSEQIPPEVLQLLSSFLSKNELNETQEKLLDSLQNNLIVQYDPSCPEINFSDYLIPRQSLTNIINTMKEANPKDNNFKWKLGFGSSFTCNEIIEFLQAAPDFKGCCQLSIIINELNLELVQALQKMIPQIKSTSESPFTLELCLTPVCFFLPMDTSSDTQRLITEIKNLQELCAPNNTAWWFKTNFLFPRESLNPEASKDLLIYQIRDNFFKPISEFEARIAYAKEKMREESENLSQSPKSTGDESNLESSLTTTPRAGNKNEVNQFLTPPRPLKLAISPDPSPKNAGPRVKKQKPMPRGQVSPTSTGYNPNILNPTSWVPPSLPQMGLPSYPFSGPPLLSPYYPAYLNPPMQPQFSLPPDLLLSSAPLPPLPLQNISQFQPFLFLPPPPPYIRGTQPVQTYTQANLSSSSSGSQNVSAPSSTQPPTNR